MDMLSLKLIERLNRSEIRQYKIANAAGISPGQLSAFKNGIYPVRPGDPRIIRVGKILGLRADECFAPE